MPESFHNKLCVITGGSSGIGYSIAEQLAQQGARLLLVARDADKLEHAAEQLRQHGAREVVGLSADINQAQDVQRIAPAIAAMEPAHGAADLLVNSAGIVSAGVLEDVPAQEWQRLFQLNVFALVAVLQALLPAMQRKAATGTPGQIINIASAAGMAGFPGMAAYGASKAAVIALGDSLRAELSGQGIGVTTVCPGFVQTPIADKIELFGRMDNPKVRGAIQNWFERNNLSPQQVARASLNGARRRKALVVVGRDARAGYWTKRLLPALLRRTTAAAALPPSSKTTLNRTPS